MKEVSLDLLLDSIIASEPFRYPDDEGVTEQQTGLILSEKLSEMLTKMAVYIIPSKDPRLTLIALFYCAGVDTSHILNCENTEAALAKKCGISKQKMSSLVQQIRIDFNLHNTSTHDQGRTPEAYSNNHRKLSV